MVWRAEWWSMAKKHPSGPAISRFALTELDAKIIAAGMRKAGLRQVRISEAGGLWRVRGVGDVRRLVAQVVAGR